MKSLMSVAIASVMVTVAGCAAETTQSSDELGESMDDLAASKVRLPSGDPCRAVLAPLSLGLASGARGLAFTSGISVSLTSATDTRLYAVSIAGIAGTGSPVLYEVELDNDSGSKCFLLSATPAPSARLLSDARSKAKDREVRSTSPIFSPRGDDCMSTVQLLAQAAGVSAVGASLLEKVVVALESETEDRDYVAHVDGKSFVANGKTFPNDFDFALSLSNDSASKCFVQGVSLK